MVVSFVIVEYFSIEDIEGCIPSIIANYSDNAYEIIISSNSLYEVEIQHAIQMKYTKYKWIFNTKNGGFAYAMNQGLQAAIGDILIILNPDVRVRFGLCEMVKYMYENHRVGAIAPKIVNKNGIVQDSYRDFITPLNFVFRHMRRFLNRDNSLDIKEPISVDWVIGAFVMMSKEVYSYVNGLDDNYFLYCEDMDLCKRIKQRGYEVIYFPYAEVEYEGTRSARHSVKYAFIFLKSLCRFWRKFGLS